MYFSREERGIDAKGKKRRALEARETQVNRMAKRIDGLLDEVGFEAPDANGWRNTGPLRACLDRADENVTFYVFNGKPGWSQVVYQVAFSFEVPYAVIEATLKKILESLK